MSSQPDNSVLVSIDDAFAGAVDAGWLEGIALRVLEAEGAAAVELGVVVADDETVRGLNRQYAGEDAATDVLSFSLREGEEFVGAPEAGEALGEVIISYPTALRQARESGRVVDEEVAHLLVHGILHLLGYDHAEREDERRMRSREEELLGEVGHG